MKPARCNGQVQGRYPCNHAATHFVTYWPDGQGGEWSCRQHLAQAISGVLARPDVDPSAAVVRVVDVARVIAAKASATPAAA